MSHDDVTRDRLLVLHVSWAAAIALNVHRRVNSYPVDRDDFIQNATIGLLDAITRFDPARGVPFRSYARPRVRGAVFNGLRAILGERSQQPQDSRFNARLGDLQDAGEDSAFDQLVDTIVGLGVGYLLDEASHGASCASRDALAYAQTVQIETRLLQAVSQLPERLKAIVLVHYFQYVPFKDVALQMGVSKGRVSQMHREALMRLRASLRD